jgi:hypothetical protein
MGAASMGTSRAISKQQTQATLSAQEQEIQRQEQDKAAAEQKHREEKAAWEKEKADQKAKEERLAWERQMESKYGAVPGGFPGGPPVYSEGGQGAGGGEKKFCPACGNQYTLGANFCTSCGNKLGGL